MSLKENFTYGVLAFDLVLFVAWPFLVFFHFIIAGLIMMAISVVAGVILYEIYRAANAVEHKVIHHPHVENKPN